MNKQRIQSFAPLLSTEPKVLILGTMPSVKSLDQQEYYGNKQNAFWKILFTLFQHDFSIVYADRVALIQQNHLALWDVLQSCERTGSLDAAIKAEQPNDIQQFIRDYPSIHTIVFSSQKAEHYFRKYIGTIEGIHTVTLPSPSGANARMSLEEKITAWSCLTAWCKP